MIVVDSSVWIDHFNGRSSPSLELLDGLSGSQLLVGDLIMAEVLQGFRKESEFHRAWEALAAFEFRSMVGRDIAIAAARNHRLLRQRGVTPRGTIGTMIATFCIVNGHQLLHSDRDFDPFARYLELQVVLA
jgi:predicted nucleic acid-binding protein